MHTEVDLDFAKEALHQVTNIAAVLGVQKKLCHAGRMAAELCLTLKALDITDESQAAQLQQRFPRLIHDVERLCAVRITTQTRLIKSCNRKYTQKHGIAS